MVRNETARVLPDGRISRAEAARYIGVSANTLRAWDVSGRHDDHYRKLTVAGRVYYRFEQIVAFVEAQMGR